MSRGRPGTPARASVMVLQPRCSPGVWTSTTPLWARRPRGAPRSMAVTSSWRPSELKSYGVAARGGGGALDPGGFGSGSSGTANAAAATAPATTVAVAIQIRRRGRAGSTRAAGAIGVGVGSLRVGSSLASSVVGGSAPASGSGSGSGTAALIAASRRQYGPISATASSSSASHASAADCGRAAGSLASSHSTQSQTACRSGPTIPASGGGAVWTWA